MVKTIKGGWMKCLINDKKISCNLEKSRGHIIPNKGGSFNVKTLYLDELNRRAVIKIDPTKLDINPGLDTIIECKIYDKKTAHCSTLR